MPVLLQPLSGHSSDAHECGQVVKDHIAPLQTTSGTTYLVADSALSTADNLQKLAETQIKWITRVPATVSSHSAPRGWRSTYFPRGMLRTHSQPPPCYVVIA
jgi:transposase